MKIIANVARLFVGALFIFSGLIKINDPVGFAIKLEEYFDVFSTDIGSVFELFMPFSLPIAVAICVMEVAMGIAMLLNYKIKLTIWITLGMIVFFTFLTFYSAYFNKVTDCGCFGDAIPLTPWESFYKDVILLVLVLIMFFYRNMYKTSELGAGKSGHIIVGVSSILLFVLAIHIINHLPIIDFRPYKIGNNIAEQMEPAASPIFEYVMEKDGEEFRFKKYPTDKSYTFKEVITTNEKETIPKITDYSLWNDEGDFTEESLNGTKLFLIYQNLDKMNNSYASQVNELIENTKNVVDAIAITASSGEAFEEYRHENQLAIPYYFSDGTVLKAMIRSNPGLILVENGTVRGKWHFNDIPTADEIIKRVM